jgi:hypothetical protein
MNEVQMVHESGVSTYNIEFSNQRKCMQFVKEFSKFCALVNDSKNA